MQVGAEEKHDALSSMHGTYACMCVCMCVLVCAMLLVSRVALHLHSLVALHFLQRVTTIIAGGAAGIPPVQLVVVQAVNPGGSASRDGRILTGEWPHSVHLQDVSCSSTRSTTVAAYLRIDSSGLVANERADRFRRLSHSQKQCACAYSIS